MVEAAERVQGNKLRQPRVHVGDTGRGADGRAGTEEPALPAAPVLRRGEGEGEGAGEGGRAREGRGPAQAPCEAVEESSL